MRLRHWQNKVARALQRKSRLAPLIDSEVRDAACLVFTRNMLTDQQALHFQFVIVVKALQRLFDDRKKVARALQMYVSTANIEKKKREAVRERGGVIDGGEQTEHERAEDRGERRARQEGHEKITKEKKDEEKLGKNDATG